MTYAGILTTCHCGKQFMKLLASQSECRRCKESRSVIVVKKSRLSRG